MIRKCEAGFVKGLGIENNSMKRRKPCVAGSRVYIAPRESGRVRLSLDGFVSPQICDSSDNIVAVAKYDACGTVVLVIVRSVSREIRSVGKLSRKEEGS